MLCEEAEKHPGCRLPVPVRFIMDDFATNARVPDFDNIISVIRSREIAVSIIIQSITQLDGIYGPEKARTIINNCDNMLYLGGQDISTAELVSVKTDYSRQKVLEMEINDAILFTRGKKFRHVKKYDPMDHPEYENVADFFGRERAEYEDDTVKSTFGY